MAEQLSPPRYVACIGKGAWRSRVEVDLQWNGRDPRVLVLNERSDVHTLRGREGVVWVNLNATDEQLERIHCMPPDAIREVTLDEARAIWVAMRDAPT